MVKVTYSNRTERLLERLSKQIRDDRMGPGSNGFWDPVQIVVPNTLMQEYIRMGLANDHGVVANVSFSYLNDLWRDLLGSHDHTILSSDLLKTGLLKVLGESHLFGDDLAPVRSYLREDHLGLKRAQLATELAHLFEEYQYSRPDWIAKWRQGFTAPTNAESQNSAIWQGILWAKAVAALDTTGKSYVTLDEALGKRETLQGKLAKTIHVFALSHVAPIYHQVYKRIGGLPGINLHIYALNPCAEFWEDLVTARERRPTRQAARITVSAPGELPTRGAEVDSLDGDVDPYQLRLEGPEALRLWGVPGRENIRMLNEISNWDFQPDFQTPGTDTLLGILQSDILNFTDPPFDRLRIDDDSVRLLAAPTARREAEIVANEVWRLMESQAGTESPLRFSDIAIVIPPAEQDVYLANLEIAFLETHKIPWVHSKSSQPVLKEVLEAVDLLFELPISGLTRAAVLRVLESPAVRRRFHEPGTEAWARWCEALGIVRGLDQKAWEQTYVQENVLNWAQGLQRLALGAFMEDGTVLEGCAPTYRAQAVADHGSAGQFLALARALLTQASALESGNFDLVHWISRFDAYLKAWLETDNKDSVKALDRVRAKLQELANAVPKGLLTGPLSYRCARYLVKDALASLQDQNRASLTRGVVVSSYSQSRAIPFRVTFLMGLSEGVFPTRDGHSQLDLRAGTGRRSGDVSQTEKEKYLFLEGLLSTRDQLILSYVAMDDLSGEKKEPSGLIKEFRNLLSHYLPDDYRPVKGVDPFVERFPLHRFDPESFPTWFPADIRPIRRGKTVNLSPVAQAEARALWLRDSLAGGIPIDLPPFLPDLPAPEATYQFLLNHLAGLEAPKRSLPRPTLRISLTDLRKWLECPLTGAAAVRLGLRKRTMDDHRAVEDEPFECAFLDAWTLQREVLWLALHAKATSPDATLEEAFLELQAQGGAPFGLLGEAERTRLLGPVKAWWLHMQSQHGAPDTWRFGPAKADASKVHHPEPALSLDAMIWGEKRKVALVGDLRVQWGGSVFLETGKPPRKGDYDRLFQKALEAYLDHLLLTIAMPGHKEHQARFIFEEGNPSQEVQIPFHAMSPEKARGTFVAWIEDLFNLEHNLLLPIEAVLEGWPEGGPTRESIGTYVQEKLQSRKEDRRFSTANGPVPDPTRYRPPEAPRSLVEGRMGDFLRQIFPTPTSEEGDS